MTKIEGVTDFDTRIRDNPVELLKEARKFTTETDRLQSPYLVGIDILAKTFYVKQTPDDTLIEYKAKLKQAKEVFEAQFSKSVFDEFVKNTPEYKKAFNVQAEKKLTDQGMERFFGVLTIRNACSKRYGSFQENLKSSFSLNRDEYPDSLDSAIDLLNNQKWDQT